MRPTLAFIDALHPMFSDFPGQLLCNLELDHCQVSVRLDLTIAWSPTAYSFFLF